MPTSLPCLVLTLALSFQLCCCCCCFLLVCIITRLLFGCQTRAVVRFFYLGTGFCGVFYPLFSAPVIRDFLYLLVCLFNLGSDSLPCVFLHLTGQNGCWFFNLFNVDLFLGWSGDFQAPYSQNWKVYLFSSFYFQPICVFWSKMSF